MNKIVAEKEAAEGKNPPASMSHIQELNQRFDDLQHDLRSSMVAVEGTQKTVLTTFIEFKTETQNESKKMIAIQTELKKRIDDAKALIETNLQESKDTYAT